MTDSTVLTLVADLVDHHGTHLAFAPDGGRWALADSRNIVLGRAGVVEERITTPGPVHHVAFTRDGRRLLACPEVYDLEQRAWDAQPSLDAALVAGLDEPPSPDQLGIAAGVFAPDGEEMVVETRFQPSRGVGAVDTYRGPKERLLVMGPDRALRGVLYAGEGELRAIAVGDRRVAAGGVTVTLWDRASRRELAALAHHQVVVRALAFRPGGDELGAVAADGTASLWDTAGPTLSASWKAHEGDGYAIALHPTLPLVATGGMDGMLRLWSTDGRLRQEVSLDGWVRAVAFDPTGARLAAAARSSPPRVVMYALSNVRGRSGT